MAKSEPASSSPLKDRAWLRTWRESQGLSRPGLAGQLGSSADSVRRWESGESSPQGRFHASLAAAMRITVPELRTRLGLSALANPSNVHHLRGTDAATSSTPRRDAPEKVAARREAFEAAMLTGLSTGYACNDAWNLAAERLAAWWGLDWPPAGGAPTVFR